MRAPRGSSAASATQIRIAMVADQQMLDDGLQICGKTFDGIDRFGNGLEFHHDVAEELAFDGVADGALVTKLIEFADVVQNRGSPAANQYRAPDNAPQLALRGPHKLMTCSSKPPRYA